MPAIRYSCALFFGFGRDVQGGYCLSSRFSFFQQRWISETIRLCEARQGAFDDREALRQARALPAPADAEQRIVERACRLADDHGVSAAVAALRLRGRWLASILLLLGVFGGFGAALAVLGDGARPVNVIWALAGLLGVNLLSLLLWCAGLWFGKFFSAAHANAGGGVIGRLWLWLSRRLTSGEVSLTAIQALSGLMRRARLLPWWFGAISHAVWLGILLGVLAGLLSALAVRGYSFVWETTILPADVFVDFVAALGWLPARFGFAVPDAQAVRASGAVMAGAGDEALRLVWSSWLVGCVTVYGILPRLLLAAACFAGVLTGQRRVRLDLSLPQYASLLMRVMPQSERLGVTDGAPAALAQPHLHNEYVAGSGNAMIAGIELRTEIPWPPALPAGVADAGVADSREQRQRLLTRLAAQPPLRLLVVCDARLSPDRGTLALIASLSRYAGDCRVWIMTPQETPPDEERFGHWRAGLRETGLPPYGMFDDETAALAWLERGDD